jgi:hypothetical protein
VTGCSGGIKLRQNTTSPNKAQYRLGGCLIGSIDRNKLLQVLCILEWYEILAILAAFLGW